jgi:hypothetical protein
MLLVCASGPDQGGQRRACATQRRGVIMSNVPDGQQPSIPPHGQPERTGRGERLRNTILVFLGIQVWTIVLSGLLGGMGIQFTEFEVGGVPVATMSVWLGLIAAAVTYVAYSIAYSRRRRGGRR